MPEEIPLIAVFGATGYVGGRLIPKLLDAGYKVRAVSRSLEKLQQRNFAYHPSIDLMAADVFDKTSLQEALKGVHTAYYLVHSMGTKGDFTSKDRQAASAFAEAAQNCGIKRIIYLGGLGDQSSDLSEHLKSRREVGKILETCAVPLTYLRAAIIIGSGSASFEILRYLVDRLPFMITPRWVKTKNQPIAISDVLDILVLLLKHPHEGNETYDIGGNEVLTYEELMRIYNKEAGLMKRLIIPVPVLTPFLSSLWIGLISPVPPSVARPLIEGLKNEVICHDNVLPQRLGIKSMPIREAIRLALELTREGYIETSWVDAGVIPPEMPQPQDPFWSGGTLLSDCKKMLIAAPPPEVWSSVTHIGGSNGWYYANWLWRIRGFIDRLMGGVGLRRGRKDAFEILAGDAIDFWRVKVADNPKRLLLVAEMRVPGIATLEFLLEAKGDHHTEVTQTARFYPKGLFGILYWKAMLPFHHYIFNGMLRGIRDQTRLHKRRPVNIQAKLKLFSFTIDCTITDLSEGGCRLIITNPTQMKFSINMPLEIYIKDLKLIRAHISHIEPQNNSIFLGIQFSRLQVFDYQSFLS
ncbi:MAG: DUF2867 domain-containing protein [Parachlamydiales bacterium]|nr:DUF2867 domain-containing protein [Parachlamydiales bacterium]